MAKATKSPASVDSTGASERVAALIDKQDAKAVAEAVRGLSAADRRAVGKALPGHVKALWARRREPWHDILAYAPAFRAAGVGTMTGASAVAAWLNRRELGSRWSDHKDTELLLGLLDDRDDAWLVDLTRRLTERLRGPRHVGLDLVLALLARTGIEPPEHDPLVVGWVSSTRPRENDPVLTVLLPRIFEADGVGRVLRDEPRWPRNLAALAARGVLDRGMLLDGCVRRFLRGGTQNDLRFFVRLHELLVPGRPAAREVEIRARARDYARLLPAAPGTVARLALGLLREVPELPSELVVEALGDVLFRAETGLAKSGLSWLEQTARQSPALAAECVPALVQAFGHESPAVQERAVRIALKLPDGTDSTALAAAVPLLPPELGAQAAARFGGDVAEAELDEDPPPPGLAPPGPPDPLPPLPSPIISVAKLAEAIRNAELDRVRGRSQAEQMATAEQMMAAFVRLTWQDAEAVQAALKPVQPDTFRRGLDSDRCWRGPHEWLLATGSLLAGSGPLQPGWRDRLPSARVIGGPNLLFLSRCAELYAAVEDGSLPPLLLATPTEPTGHLDPMTLVERLEQLQAAGAEPGPADLQQAVLRLPRGSAPEAARRAAALTSPAGRDVAELLAAGGLPVPEVSMRPLEQSRPEAVISVASTGLPLVDAVFTAPPKQVRAGHGWYRLSWQWLLPSHPEVIAAHILPHLLGGRDLHHPAFVNELVGFVPGDGPFAEAVGRFLVHQIVEWTSEWAVEALLTMAARGDLPSAAFGQHIGRLAVGGDIQLARVTEALERVAEAGAYADVWRVIAAALPVLCPGPGVRPVHGLDRLIALGLRTARWSAARGAIPEIDELASRKGSTNMVREARALGAYLAG